uniref:ABC protein, subfamily ABCC n=1 Tax=Scolopendra viridis TaxID=118503 RepID=A0A4D5R9Z5_SCOVI
MVATDDECSFGTPPTGSKDDMHSPSYYSASDGQEELSSEETDDTSRHPAEDVFGNGYLALESKLQAGLPLDNDDRFSDSRNGIPSYTSRGHYYYPKKGWKKYSGALQTLIPMRVHKSKNDSKVLPIDDLSLFSFVFYSWLTNLMWRTYKKGLQPDQVPACSPLECCDLNCQRIEYLWEAELESRGPEGARLQRVIWRFMRTRMLFALVLFIISLVAGFLGPTIFMRKLLEYAQKSDVLYSEGLLWLFGLFMMEVLRVLMFACMWTINYRTALRLRSGCLAMLYSKVMRLRNLGNKTVGEFINLFANDGSRIFEFVTYGPLIVGGPIVAIGGTIFIGCLLGPAALAGMATFVLFYPFQYLISRLTGYLRRKTIKVTDERVRFVNEILTCVKLIKLYAWEKPFAKSISEIRKQERKLLEKAAYVQSTSIAMAPTVPIIAAIVTFLAHIGAGNNLTPAEAFTVIGGYTAIRFTFAIIPYSISSIAELIPSIARMKSVLLMEDKQPFMVKPPEEDQAIFISQATLAWDIPQKTVKAKKKNKKVKKRKELKHYVSEEEKVNLKENTEMNNHTISTLFSIDLILRKGQLIGVCGSVGSGKSSLIAAILGQMRIVSGKIACQGKIAYAAQQAWILNATLKENIVFGSSYDSKRYYEAIYSCSLNQDIASLPAGDETEIGERGINVSGGQKQRISLARAVYSNRDIYLLDDPLSAVDAHVGKHIFDQCVRGVLRGKSILFVTHQLQYLSSCDSVLLMKGGQIAEHGTHEELLAKDGEYAALIRTFHTEDGSVTKSDENHSSQSFETEENSSQRGKQLLRRESSKISKKQVEQVNDNNHNIGKLMTEEKMNQGNIDCQSYLVYMKAGGGYIISFIVLISFIVNIGTTAFSSWWLSKWIHEGSGNTEIYDPVTNTSYISNSITDNPDLDLYQLVYGLSIILILVTSFIRSYLFMKATLRASSKLHDKLFTKIFYSPMRFFDTTPIGRIINLFARDMDEIDVRLPFVVETFLQNLWVILFSLLFVVLIFPWFLIPMAVLSIMFFFLYVIFRVAVRDLKRIENITRSPIYSHVNATIQGLATVHAYQKESEFIETFMTHMDNNTSPFFLFNCGMRWLALRLDLLVVSITVITGLFVVLTHGHVSPAYAGLAMAYAAQLTGLFQYTVRLCTETEARFTSVERIHGYIQSLETETTSVDYTVGSLSSWPSEGCIEFSKVSMRYRSGLPLVLKGLNFIIKPKEKIGIVGRTGSGKSSLGVVLFRLVELASGSIYIDGVDISKVGLEELRSKMSLIPQDPILFIGTVRYNLDPFSLYSDESIWQALEKTYMKEKILSLENKLLAPVVENGENFSVGERQLLCMARALLRNSKILLLDEATAAIDTETDAFIQTTIRQAFSECTILTIAHRLNTVLHCNRVMVLEDGEMREMDQPSVLLSHPNSMFSAMLAAAETTSNR